VGQVRNEEEDERDYRAVAAIDWQVVEWRRPSPRIGSTGKSAGSVKKSIGWMKIIHV
jgi:hypothetical protein